MDVEADLNRRGFEIINLLDVEELSPVKPLYEPKHTEDNLIGEVCLGTFKMVEGSNAISSHYDVFNNNIDVQATLRDKKIGLNQDKYKVLVSLAEDFMKLEYFKKYTDYKYISNKIFEWIVKIVNDGKADYELVTFIRNEVEKDLKTYTFLFRVESLIIDKEFTVANSTFTFRTAEYFENLHRDIYGDDFVNNPKQKELLLKSNDRFINKVLVSASAKGVLKKAELIAKKEVELSINAIKCFLINEALHPNTELFNVDYLYMSEFMSNFISLTDNNKNYTHHLQSKNSPTPIRIDAHKLSELNKWGLELVAKFISNKKETELYYAVELQINLLGEINSTMNLYSRITKMISFFENMIIPAKNTSSNGQTYINKNIIAVIPINDKDRIKQSVNRMYKVRDRYLHNREPLPFNVQQLYDLKRLSVMFLLETVVLSDTLSTKEEVQNYFGIHYKSKKDRTKKV